MRFVIDNGLKGVAALSNVFPRSRRARAQVDLVAKDVRYAPGHGEFRLLDVYRPKQYSGKLPVLFYVHGGGFRILSKDTHRYFAYRFAAEGFLVVTINYRLTPAGAFPKALEDCTQALLWTLQHAPDYDGDLSRLVYSGESAGGNLSSALAICGSWKRDEPFARDIWDANPAPAALVPACGLLEVGNPERYLERDDLPGWIKKRIAVVCSLYRPEPSGDDDLASPLRFLETAEPPERPFPRVFAPCGEGDPIADDTRRLGSALERLQLPGSTEFYKGGHAFHAFPWSEQAEDCWTDQFNFIHGAIGTETL